MREGSRRGTRHQHMYVTPALQCACAHQPACNVPCYGRNGAQWLDWGMACPRQQSCLDSAASRLPSLPSQSPGAQAPRVCKLCGNSFRCCSGYCSRSPGDLKMRRSSATLLRSLGRLAASNATSAAAEARGGVSACSAGAWAASAHAVRTVPSMLTTPNAAAGQPCAFATWASDIISWDEDSQDVGVWHEDVVAKVWLWAACLLARLPRLPLGLAIPATRGPPTPPTLHDAAVACLRRSDRGRPILLHQVGGWCPGHAAQATLTGAVRSPSAACSLRLLPPRSRARRPAQLAHTWTLTPRAWLRPPCSCGGR